MKPRYSKPMARDLGGLRAILASGQWDGPPVPCGPDGTSVDDLNTCPQGFSVASNCSIGSAHYGSWCDIGGGDRIPTCGIGSQATVTCNMGFSAAA